MPDQYPHNPRENREVKVFIYEPELNYLKWLVRQKPRIETGGDLFGLWQDENTAVVQLILGPGKKCKRTSTSFHQDVRYLKEVGEYFTSSLGLCNFGEWHSHHTLGLARPSTGDQNTVWNHMSSVAGGKFLVFIANIEGTPQKVNIGCFLFNSRRGEMLTGSIISLPYPSPLRLTVDNKYLTSKAENGQDWNTYSKYHPTITNYQSTSTRKRSPNETRTAKKMEKTTSNDTIDATDEESFGEEDHLIGSEKQEISICCCCCGRICQPVVCTCGRICQPVVCTCGRICQPVVCTCGGICQPVVCCCGRICQLFVSICGGIRRLFVRFKNFVRGCCCHCC